MSVDAHEVDPDAFLALLAEEGYDVSDAQLNGGDDDDHDGDDAVGLGEPIIEDAPIDAKPGLGAGRMYPPKRAAPAKPRISTSTASTASSSGSSLPSYMRGTASRPSYGHSSTGGGADRSRSPAARTDRSEGGFRSGSNSNSKTPKTPASGSETPMIAGKTAFSSLPENAGRAEIIRQVEATITASVGAGKVTMDDVVGLEDAKRALEEAIVFPRMMAAMGTPMAFTKGALLYGPPGTGKTQLARAQATSSGCAFFAVTASSIMSKWLGESEKMVRALFDAARYYAPAIVFIDEVDALTGERGGGGEHEAMLRVKNELLAQLDGMSSGSSDPDKMVLCLGATNRPWALDEAFRRRFEKRILIPLPDEQMRRTLFQKTMKSTQMESDVDFGSLAVRTHGYNCADIVQICRDAIVGPLRELSVRMKAEGVPVTQMMEYVKTHGIRANAVAARHFDDALRRIKSSVGNYETQTRMREWEAEFGST